MGAFVSQYLSAFVSRFGEGWNRFWYSPSDPYPLGLMRIGLGLLLLYLHATYTADLVTFFGPNGMISQELVETLASGRGFNPTYFSHLYGIQSAQGLYIAHVIGAVILLLFTVGFKSRVMCVLTLLLTLAYYHRAPFVTSAVEPITCMLLFYMCFGPCGASLSVDRWLANRRAQNDPIFAKELAARSRSFAATISLRLMQVHVTVIYLAMGLAKLSGPPQIDAGAAWTNPWHTGNAVWLLAARAESPWIDLTGLLAANSYLFNMWTLAIMVFEIAFGILIWNRLARPLLLLIAIPMWGSLALISGIAPFCMAMLIANVAFFSREMVREFSPSSEGAGDVAASAAA